jgi:chorismate mutase
MSINLDLLPFDIEGSEKKRPIIMAGPCSAESEEQVMTTARELAANGVKIFRAGIWKPRTRPGAFEGVGSIGLPWLKKVKEELGMSIAIEVANVKHVYEALKAGVDILWIGARTSANPFAVQEIADALTGVDIPILVKNPVNPDLELWIGAIERINRAGIKKLGAIHRGFSTYGKSMYRNNPHWQVPIELRRRIPELPIIVDPSHICGNRDLLFEISQKAMDLNFDGLIVETHNNPDDAWSDSAQQVTPTELQRLLDMLILRRADIDNSLVMNDLEELRSAIDKYDDKIIEIFANRMDIAEKIGQYKKDHNITILQTSRWDVVLKGRLEKAMQKGLSEEFILKVFRAIHQESINHQMQIMNK